MSQTVEISSALAEKLLAIAGAFSEGKRHDAVSYGIALGESAATKIMGELADWAQDARKELAEAMGVV